MVKDIEIKIDIEQLRALLEGKKLVIDVMGQPKIIIYPDRYGVFMTYDKFVELRKNIGWQVLADTDGFFKELLGEQMFEKIFKNKK